jgi:hypothetical protein
MIFNIRINVRKPNLTISGLVYADPIDSTREVVQQLYDLLQQRFLERQIEHIVLNEVRFGHAVEILVRRSFYGADDAVVEMELIEVAGD